MNDVFTVYNIVAVIIAYLMGSVPTSVWIGKAFFGKDVREHGSGNAGASNTFRVLGKSAGIPVLFIDIFKGWAAIKALSLFSIYAAGSDALINFQLILGLAAVLGHIFPVYVGFKGGKGIATLLGVILAVHLEAALVSLGIFLVVFLTTRIVSIGSITAALSFPFVLMLVFKIQTPSLQYFAMAVAVAVLLTHQKNIERLLRKEENRMTLRLKPRSRK